MIVTTKRLAEILAGGDSYIRTKNNIVQGLAITTRDNPQAPEVIVVGSGPRIIANAKLFLKSDSYVPVYVKQKVNQWKLLGNYKADSYHQDLETINKYRKHRQIEDVDGILFLSEQRDDEVMIVPRRVIDIEAKKKVELAAIDFVTSHYQNMNFVVTDCQSDNCGYDLYVERGKEVFKVEVKGTSSSEQRFYLSRNERKKSADPLWRLAVVTDVLKKSTLEIFDTETMESRFNFDPMSWECTQP